MPISVDGAGEKKKLLDNIFWKMFILAFSVSMNQTLETGKALL